MDAGRLWTGGAATALVAALVAMVGVLIARGLFQVPVLAPTEEGTLGNAGTFRLAAFAAALSPFLTGADRAEKVATSAITPAVGSHGWIDATLADQAEHAGVVEHQPAHAGRGTVDRLADAALGDSIAGLGGAP